MSIRIRRWTGREAMCLKEALRMTNLELAERLGMSPTSVKNWRRGGEKLACKTSTSQLLDRMVDRLSPVEEEAFRALLIEHGAEFELVDLPPTLVGEFSLTSHQFIPLHLGPTADALRAAAAPCPPGPAGLDRRMLRLATDGSRDGTLYVYDFHVAVLHIRQPLRLDSVTDLALWRYPSYFANRAWAQQVVSVLVTGLLGEGAGVPVPDYVLSLYELHQHPWKDEVLDAALQLLATPGALVDRSADGENPLPLGIEEERLSAGWRDGEAVTFSGGREMSRGVASWSGVAYHPAPDERALPVGSIVAMELDTQALWALSAHLLGQIEAGFDPTLPGHLDWRWLRGAHFRLTAARPTETVHDRLMRAAIIGTSDLPQRLQDAWTALKESS
ncbi:XRE family transcriptional regulator [Kitasatospora sp. NPDC088548]|uniref:XRE family transcriptional regulator n=1 Tax=Kitasatospora sp. NPDC088548 TaxID=3364075 RepID=UPI00381648F9